MQHQNDDCKIYRMQLFDYVSDMLSEAESEALLSHLDNCPQCKEELLKIKTILGAATALPEVEVPEGLRESISAQISSLADNPRPRKVYSIRRFASVALPLAACAVLAIGIYSNGLLDSFINSDEILSSSVTTETESVSPSNETHNDETPTTTENENTAIAPDTDFGSAHTEAPAKSETETKAQTDNANQSERTEADQTTAESEPIQSDSNNISSGGNAEANNASIAIAEYPVAEEADNSAAYNARAYQDNSSYPVSCTIITDNVSAFAAQFDGVASADEISIEISADKLDAIMEFAAVYGAEISFEYSSEHSDTIMVTVQTKE